MKRYSAAISAFALILASPLVSASTGPGDPGAMQDAANRHIGLVSSLALTDPNTPGALESWIGARAGDPLIVWGYRENEPSYAVVPVLSAADELVGTIGVGVKSGDWEWYAEAPPGAKPPVTADEAVRIFRDQSGAAVTAKSGWPRVVSMADRHLYWYLSWADSDGSSRELFVDVRDSTRILTEGVRDQAGLAGSESPPGHRASGRARTVLSQSLNTDPDYPPAFSLDVPHHFQETSYNCGPAALHMVFDYWDEEIVQSEIARAANTTPSYGTPRSNLRRAAHFSHRSTAEQDLFLNGYEKRDLGYAAMEQEWLLPENYETRYEDLKRLISSGYPLILATWFDNTHTVGHYRVLKGYNDRANVFIVHDPWYSGQYQGPNLFFQQHILVDLLWKFPSIGEGQWALLAAPWEVRISAPDSVAIGETFTVSAVVTYPGPHPYEGQAVISDAHALIELEPGLRLASGDDPEEWLTEIRATGSVDSVSWQILAALDGMAGPAELTVTGSGLVTGSSLTYPEYSDEIGGSSRAVIVVTDRLTVIRHDIESQPGAVDMSWRLNRQIDLADLSLTAIRGEEQWAVSIVKSSSMDFSARDCARQLAAGGEITYSLCIRSGDECFLLHSSVVEVASSIAATRLLGTLPNPTTLPANVSFLVDRSRRVRIGVYDSRGRRIAVIVDEPYEIGWHVALWDGRDGGGREVPSGGYLIRLDSEGCRETRSFLLVK